MTTTESVSRSGPPAGWRTLLLASGAPASDPFAHVPTALARVAEAGPGTRLLAFRTLGPTVAFSRRDTLADGYADAHAAAQAHGFVPAVRPVGGTFAPLHRGSLVVDQYGVVDGGWRDMHVRFARHTEALVAAFARLGLDARLGAVPGEYCPGDFSVSAGGRVKVSGTAQRVTRGAWLTSSVVQVGDAGPLAEVTAACARALGRDVDPGVTGSIETETGVGSVVVVARAITQAFAERGFVGRGAAVGLGRLPG